MRDIYLQDFSTHIDSKSIKWSEALLRLYLSKQIASIEQMCNRLTHSVSFFVYIHLVMLYKIHIHFNKNKTDLQPIQPKTNNDSKATIILYIVCLLSLIYDNFRI